MSLIIWSKLPSSDIYSHRVLSTFTSEIMGIIRISNREIICGVFDGGIYIWDIDQGLCIRHIIYINNILWQMKQHKHLEVAITYSENISVFGPLNNWDTPYKQFIVCDGYSIEFLSEHILLRGGLYGQLEFIDYAQIGGTLPPAIFGLHSISVIQRIAKNIVVTASMDGTLKVIDPIYRKCYLNFQKDDKWVNSLAYVYI